MIFFRKSHPIHPIENVVNKMQDLNISVKAVKALPPQMRPFGGRRDLASADIWGPYSNLGGLQSSVGREFKAWSVDVETSQRETKKIVDCFRRFEWDLHHLCQRQGSIDQKIPGGLLKDIIGAAKAMARAVRELEKAVAAGSVLVVREHTDYLEQFLKIRAAMARLNPDAAKRLRGQDVDNWCEWPGVNLSDSHDVDSMARLLMADQQEHQMFELRCRSKTPGRPLKLMTWGFEFPSEDDLFTKAALFKRPDKIFVAALEPTWRIVWTFHRENEGW